MSDDLPTVDLRLEPWTIHIDVFDDYKPALYFAELRQYATAPTGERMIVAYLCDDHACRTMRGARRRARRALRAIRREESR